MIGHEGVSSKKRRLWRCDVYQEVVFDTHDEAVEHEAKCRRRQHKGRVPLLPIGTLMAEQRRVMQKDRSLQFGNATFANRQRLVITKIALLMRRDALQSHSVQVMKGVVTNQVHFRLEMSTLVKGSLITSKMHQHPMLLLSQEVANQPPRLIQ